MTLLANDLVVLEDNCNLSCGYCLTGQSQFKKQHSLKQIFDPPRPATLARGTELHARTEKVLAACEQKMTLPIIKVTGGEIFLIRGVMEFLAEVSTRYATVVVQTNGVLLDAAVLAELRRWGNVCLQISLDASSYAGNSYRSRSPEQHERTMEKMTLALDAGIPTEIYCVLNDRSAPALDTTLDWLAPWAGHALLAPFPVRGPDRLQFAPKAEQLPVLKKVLADPRHAGVLPPAAYQKRLIRFLDEGERTFRCHLPRFAFTTFDDGTLTPCPNIWFMQLGNVLRDDADAALERLGTAAFYELLLAQRPRLDACKHCFTPWDLLSMYFDAEITLDELCRCPMYAAPASRVRIEEIVERERRCTSA